MQWLYDLIRAIWVFLSSFLGKFFWVVRNTSLFYISVVSAVFTVWVLVWRMFYFGLTSLIGYVSDFGGSLGSFTSVGSFGDLLDLANFIFPIEEVFAMLSILISYGVVCLSIRIVRAFIPTMT